MFPLEWLHTVSASSSTVTEDDYGNGTTTATAVTVKDVLYAPEGITEASGTASAPVVGDASLYGPFPLLDATATIDHDSGCCDGSVFQHGTWQVVGGSRGWAPGKSVVPIRRTGAA